MEVGEQPVDDLKSVTGIDEDIGFGGGGFDPVIGCGCGFKRSGGCCADGDDFASILCRAVNLLSGVVGD